MDPMILHRNYANLCTSFQCFDIREHQQDFIQRILAAILHIGNFFFKFPKVMIISLENLIDNFSLPNVIGLKFEKLITEKLFFSEIWECKGCSMQRYCRRC